MLELAIAISRLSKYDIQENNISQIFQQLNCAPRIIDAFPAMQAHPPQGNGAQAQLYTS